MKRGELKSSIKKTKKIIRKDLDEKLTAELKTAVEKIGYESKKVTKEIKKAANRIAKKLASKTIIATQKTALEIPAEQPASVKKAATPVKAKPVAKAPASTSKEQVKEPQPAK